MPARRNPARIAARKRHAICIKVEHRSGFRLIRRPSTAQREVLAMRYQRISADCHLDMLWLPPDLFTTNASSKLRDLMPYVAENSDGVKRWTDNNGAEYGLCGGVGATGTPHVPGKQLRADKMAEAGLYS